MSGENDGSAEQQDPGTSREQIQRQVMLDQFMPVTAGIAGLPVAGLTPVPMRYAQMADGGGGAGYEFDPDQVDAVLTKLRSVVEKTMRTGTEMSNAAKVVQPPAQDGPSLRQASAVVRSLAKAQEHNAALRRYATDFIEKLEAAKTAYRDADEHNAANAERQM